MLEDMQQNGGLSMLRETRKQLGAISSREMSSSNLFEVFAYIAHVSLIDNACQRDVPNGSMEALAIRSAKLS